MENNIHSPIINSSSKYEVRARQKTYLYTTEVYLPHQPYFKQKENLEDPAMSRHRGSGLNLTSEDDKLDRSYRRSRLAIKNVILTNPFELFVTFTFKSERQDVEKCKNKMMGWLKRRRKIDKEFQYIIISEFHKDGISLHFHALLFGYRGEIVRARSKKTGRLLVKRGRKVYDFPDYQLGNSEVYKIGDTEEDKRKTGFYLLKYVRKDMPIFKNRRRYWTSTGLKQPDETINPPEWYLHTDPDGVYEGDYGTYLYFDNKKVPALNGSD